MTRRANRIVNPLRVRLKHSDWPPGHMLQSNTPRPVDLQPKCTAALNGTSRKREVCETRGSPAMH